MINTELDYYYNRLTPYDQYLIGGIKYPAPPKGYVIIGGDRYPHIIATGNDPHGLDRPPTYIYEAFYMKVLGEDRTKNLAAWELRDLAIRDNLSIYMLRDDFFKEVESLLDSGDEETAFFSIWEAYKRDYISNKSNYKPDRTIWAVKSPKNHPL